MGRLRGRGSTEEKRADLDAGLGWILGGGGGGP